MPDIQMHFGKIEDRPINYVHLTLTTQEECDINKGEYSLFIVGFFGALDIKSYGGVDDVSLIKYCVENHINEWPLTPNCNADIILKESGEWEGYNWHKYYEVERVNVTDGMGINI